MPAPTPALPHDERAQALLRLAMDLGSRSTRESISRGVVQCAVEATGASGGTLALLDESGDHLALEFAHGYDPALVRRFARIRVDGTTPLGLATHTGETVACRSLADRLARYPALAPIANELTDGALAAVPLRVDGRTLGALGLTFAGARDLDEPFAAFIGTLGALCAQSLDRVFLLERERQARRHAERNAEFAHRLQALTAALSEFLTPEEALAAFVTQVRLATRAGFVAAWLSDDPRARFTLATHEGLSPAQVAQYAEFPYDSDKCLSRASRDHAPIWSTTRDLFGIEPSGDALGLDALVSLTCHPIVVGARVRALLLVSLPEPRQVLADERQFLQALVSQAAQALHRAGLVAAERREAARSGLLQRLTALLAEAMSLSTIGEVVARETTAALGAYAASFRLVSADGLTLDGIGGFGLERIRKWLPQSLPIETRTALHEAVRTGRPVIVESEKDRARLFPDGTIEGVPGGARLAIPVLVGGDVVGVLAFAFDGDRHFQPDEISFAEAIAKECALAVDRAQLIDFLQAAVRVRDEFLSIAAHELRTPLTALKLNVDWLAREARGAGDPLLKRTSTAVRQVTRLERLTDQLLDVTRITNGRLSLDLEECRLDELAAQVVSDQASAARDAGCDVRLCVEPVTGRWDRLRLEQVLENLLGNALKYGRGKPIEVRVRATEVDVTLDVRDEGIGIDPQDQLRIFERFERAVGARHYGGFGLGLWIVSQIVRAHAGQLTVHSAPGEGATFTVTLPRVAPDGRGTRATP